MFIYLNKRGQSTLEYAVIIAVIVGALLAIQVYIKRGVQGRLKQASDDIGEQFSPGASTYNYTTTTTTLSDESTTPFHAATGAGMEDATVSLTRSNVQQTQTRTGIEYVSGYNDTDEYWGDPSAE